MCVAMGNVQKHGYAWCIKSYMALLYTVRGLMGESTQYVIMYACRLISSHRSLDAALLAV